MLFKDDRILFLDTRDIASMENITLRMNPPEKKGVCLAVETPWEMFLGRASSIVYWEGHYRLYYTVKLDEMHRALAFAVSSDGIKWQRPKLNAVEFDGSKENNLVDIEGMRP
ncbi:MAG: hypothetical protein QHI38_10810, partial [Armatimonadota bacterium]|nr:hypothetical protein [Armatimonadota bacterium]